MLSQQMQRLERRPDPFLMNPNDRIAIGTNDTPFDLLGKCQGFYQALSDDDPVVGYAGRYGPEKKQYVGLIYGNYAKAERKGNVAMHIVRRILKKYPNVEGTGTGFCAAPLGGMSLGALLAGITGMDYIFPEKEVVVAKTPTSREQARLVFARHEVEPGTSWWIVEDVCNNFSTTEELIKLIEAAGGRVLGIICFWNRSPKFGEVFIDSQGREHLIFGLTIQAAPEYEQDNAVVAPRIAAGKVVWKPKNEWHKLPKHASRPLVENASTT